MTEDHDVRLGDCMTASSIDTSVDGIVIELHDDYTFTLFDFDSQEAIWVNPDNVDWEIYERRNPDLSRPMLS